MHPDEGGRRAGRRTVVSEAVPRRESAPDSRTRAAPARRAACRRPARPQCLAGLLPAATGPLAASLALAAMVLLGAMGCSRSEGPVNVVVVVIDTLRADHLGAYGKRGSPSPVFDALAERGVLFEQAYAPAPWTLPSTVSLLTSTMPCEHRVLVNGDRVPEELATLAERLRRTGRATASFFANPFAGPMSGLDRGFDRSELVSFEAGSRVEAWLEEVGDRPFFLYVHNVEPHDPYGPTPQISPELRRRTNRLLARYRSLTRADWSAGRPLGSTDNSSFQRSALAQLERLRPVLGALYENDVRLADTRLGGVIRALQRQGAWDRTLLFVLSDHGEAFGEHGGFQHDQSLYEELLRVPLLVRLPDDAHAGGRVASPVSLLDVVPTAAEVLDEPAVARGSRGRSLLDRLDDDPERAASGPRVVALRVNRKKHYAAWDATRGDLNVAVRDGSWKAIWNHEPGTLELYDLARDPGEQTDRSASRPDRTAALRELGRSALGACRDPENGPGPSPGALPLDDETRRRLEELGYLDPGS